MSHREDTIADYQARILKVLVYLQEHLDEAVELDDLARIACFSPFHFHRIFAAFVGETTFQYTRRLRLERAARWLLNSSDSITAIALDSGYETSAAFGKAFKQHFQKSPKQFRDERLALSPRMRDLTLRLTQEHTMKPTIRQIPDRRVLFVRKTGKYSESSQAAWGALFAHAQQRGLQVQPPDMIGISHDSPDITQEEHCRYDACIPVADDVQGEGDVGIQTLHGGKYAVFLHKGSYDSLGDTYQQIFSQWLPASPEELREEYCFEVYLNTLFDTAPDELQTEIFIPLQ